MVETSIKTLYDQDFDLWVQDTVNKLNTRNTEALDWENLIQEVEGLTRKDRRELKHRLITLFEHALKRQYVPLKDCYRGWEVTMRRTQSKLRDILTDSPNLRNYLRDIYHDCYQEALENMRIEYDTLFPNICPFSSELDVLLNDKFWKD
ncbi:DUF29 domain-containing protein [Aphanothece sacrum]|uniref:DUF29 domain-containing protein n=1 Tax=Aphanothece sacrum FPU1 TaxID=1920663 RepID=A0A401IJQ9_APHSA|nr:DUF29 domain-containing protein [Aphanothece sacrum]GBF81446.1 hypothetical protein AsFPU1_2859 [Aphanothece sacrum FPU1]GBF85577.1 hypothetical protein AsFPU3_2639 [Aphanothece sacrum FPU3]